MPINKDLKPGDYIIAGAHPVDAYSTGNGGVFLRKTAPMAGDTIEPPSLPPNNFAEIERRLAIVRDQLSKLKKR